MRRHTKTLAHEFEDTSRQMSIKAWKHMKHWGRRPWEICTSPRAHTEISITSVLCLERDAQVQAWTRASIAASAEAPGENPPNRPRLRKDIKTPGKQLRKHVFSMFFFFSSSGPRKARRSRDEPCPLFGSIAKTGHCSRSWS